ncbi:unnamed protein product [Effrenium voratum]|nr:unnamed protein product [Effrenium voratum]
MKWSFPGSLTCGAALVTCLALHSLYASSCSKKQAEAWGAPEAWRATSCQVLAAGVSCSGDQQVCTSGVQPTIMPSTCPGIFWCAGEQELCSCRGEITYATELFDGSTYAIPSVSQTYKVSSNGSWRCGTDQLGQPFVDPAPGTAKHCWCMPTDVQRVMQPYGQSSLQKERCAKSAAAAFASARRLSRAPRRLGLEALSRRRRVAYEPWALVAVESEVGQQLACAYEYGVPVAGIDTDAVQSGNLAQSWGTVASKQCWVRTHQSHLPGSDLGTCAVALVMPSSLKDAVGGMQWYFIMWVVLGFIITLLGGTAMVFSCLKERAALSSLEESQTLVGTSLRVP